MLLTIFLQIQDFRYFISRLKPPHADPPRVQGSCCSCSHVRASNRKLCRQCIRWEHIMSCEWCWFISSSNASRLCFWYKFKYFIAPMCVLQQSRCSVRHCCGRTCSQCCFGLLLRVQPLSTITYTVFCFLLIRSNHSGNVWDVQNGHRLVETVDEQVCCLLAVLLIELF